MPTQIASGQHQHLDARRRMLDALHGAGIQDARVLDAMYRVPRHRFEPEFLGASSYEDCAWPLAEHTVIRPYHIARACELAAARPSDHVLVVGKGAGFQAAVLAQLCKEVVHVELLETRVAAARRALRELQVENVDVVSAVEDAAHLGYAPRAPYDVIVFTVALATVPGGLLEQLTDSGRLVIPLGPQYRQLLTVCHKAHGTTNVSSVEACVVPQLGERCAPRSYSSLLVPGAT